MPMAVNVCKSLSRLAKSGFYTRHRDVFVFSRWQRTCTPECEYLFSERWEKKTSNPTATTTIERGGHPFPDRPIFYRECVFVRGAKLPTVHVFSGGDPFCGNYKCTNQWICIRNGAGNGAREGWGAVLAWCIPTNSQTCKPIRSRLLYLTFCPYSLHLSPHLAFNVDAHNARLMEYWIKWSENGCRAC